MSIATTPITIGMLLAAYKLADALAEDSSVESRDLHLDAYCANHDVPEADRAAVLDLAELVMARDRMVLQRTLKALQKFKANGENA